MSNFTDCDKCGKLLWITRGEQCRCKPFEFKLESNGSDDWTTVYGLDHESVAEKVVEEDWHQDPYDPSDVDSVVIFKDGKRFSVLAEARVEFSASEDTP